MNVKTNKKLIEVALPLEAINNGSKPETENPFLKGHPRSIHNWWARTPLSVARAILFAQLIDDPGNYLPIAQATIRREKLVEFVARLATWEATTDEDLISEARKMIDDQFKGQTLEFWDMFAGRASIPLEAQRLGLKVTSSDLNPVAVTIQRALLEFPCTFADRAPAHPNDQAKLMVRSSWEKTEGLQEDIRWYSNWICQEARKRLSRLYPKGPDGKLVIGWVWARTVPSPDPSCNGAHVPLVRSFQLSVKRRVSVIPVVDRLNNTFDFYVAEETGSDAKGTVSRKGAVCLISGAPMPFSYIREQAKKGKMGEQLMAIVTEGERCRVYHTPNEVQVQAARQAKPVWRPDCEMPKKHRNFQPPVYGMDNIGDLFTPRQLVALGTFCDLISEARRRLIEQTQGDNEYANAVTTYLACALSRMTDYHNSLATWNTTNENVSHLFQRQAIPMAWDFFEANPIEGKLSYEVMANWVASSLESLPISAKSARIIAADARTAVPHFSTSPIVSSDPPYYDNISYANLSDFFYVWLRRILKEVDPKTFATLLTPKDAELIASPTLHGSQESAEQHFRDGFQKVFKSISEIVTSQIPTTIYYAFKQEEENEELDGNKARVSTGWETMLEGLVQAGFQITGTWPIRTTKKARSVARNSNALASAIILVCRPRPANSEVATRRQFLMELKTELPPALVNLQRGNIAPVDMEQAAIGPGMGIYTRYSKVVDAQGSTLSVREALALINQTLFEVLTEQEGDFDSDTRWALVWFDQFGFAEGEFGIAEQLSKSKNTSVEGMVIAGILTSKSGKVRLFKPSELPADWEPEKENA